MDKFRIELVQLLSGLPNQSVLMLRLPEEFARHFGRPFLLSEYGVKKTAQLLCELTEYFKVARQLCLLQCDSDLVRPSTYNDNNILLTHTLSSEVLDTPLCLN